MPKDFLARAKNWINGLKFISKKDREKFIDKLVVLSKQEVNILLVGGTGVGKSSTINALFDIDETTSWKQSKPKIGLGPNPETNEIRSYKLNENIVVWDTPGLGESITADISNSRGINQLVKKECEDGSYLIDLVLVIFDGGSRDYSSTLKILNIVHNAVKDPGRIFIAVNRIDMICQGYGWDYYHSKPCSNIEPLIENKVKYIADLLRKELNLNKVPIVYSAGRANDGWGASRPYKIPDLFCQLIVNIPDKKRIAVIKNVKTEVIESATEEQRAVIRKSATEPLGIRIAKHAILSIATGGILGGCFITTAVCNHLNKSDNCHMLNTFRKFRDNWLVNQPDGQTLISDYYQIAPSIVEWIELKECKNIIYNHINNLYLLPCYRMIKHNRYEEAKRKYIEMVNFLNIQMKNERN